MFHLQERVKLCWCRLAWQVYVPRPSPRWWLPWPRQEVSSDYRRLRQSSTHSMATPEHAHVLRICTPSDRQRSPLSCLVASGTLPLYLSGVLLSCEPLDVGWDREERWTRRSRSLLLLSCYHSDTVENPGSSPRKCSPPTLPDIHTHTHTLKEKNHTQTNTRARKGKNYTYTQKRK